MVCNEIFTHKARRKETYSRPKLIVSAIGTYFMEYVVQYGCIKEILSFSMKSLCHVCDANSTSSDMCAPSNSMVTSCGFKH